tara:strand:+ start:1256 stop:1768 length:513 start_codon:yes stop_codon:yes gene_type:complete
MTDDGGRKRRNLIVAAGAALGLVVLLSFGFSLTPKTGRGDWPTQFRSNGEQLYFTGVNLDGEAIRATGGGHVGMMGSDGCASCHGVDRQGGRLRPFYWTVVPAITEAALTEEHGDSDGHQHSSYTSESLAQAITKGVRPDGSEIGSRMPRWLMSDQDLSDLVAFLLPEAL